MIRLKKIIYESELQEFQVEGFDLDEFLKMNKFSEQVRYAASRLERLAQGSSRIIYIINDITVLKLAKNAKGIAQNEVEASLGSDTYFSEILAKVLESDEKNRWIVMERAKKITKSRFKQFIDGVDIRDFYYYIRNNTHHNIYGMYGTFHVEENISDILNENAFTQTLIEFIQNYDLDSGDFGRISSFGEIDERLVITDYGLTKDVYAKHYAPKKK